MSVVSQICKNLDEHISSKRILEIGCGCAEFSIMASTKADNVDCIDIDNSRLLPEVNNIKNLTFQIMNAAYLTFANEAFDTIVVYNAIGHLSDEIEKITYESMRVSKNSGVFIIIANWKLDKNVITEKVTPFFNENNIKYDKVDKGNTVCVKVYKESFSF